MENHSPKNSTRKKKIQTGRKWEMQGTLILLAAGLFNRFKCFRTSNLCLEIPSPRAHVSEIKTRSSIINLLPPLTCAAIVNDKSTDGTNLLSEWKEESLFHHRRSLAPTALTYASQFLSWRRDGKKRKSKRKRFVKLQLGRFVEGAIPFYFIFPVLPLERGVKVAIKKFGCGNEVRQVCLRRLSFWGTGEHVIFPR